MRVFTIPLYFRGGYEGICPYEKKGISFVYVWVCFALMRFRSCERNNHTKHSQTPHTKITHSVTFSPRFPD